MLKIELKGMDAMLANLRGVEKQVKFANMVAVNRAAFKAREVVQREMSRVFDRPTQWVKGGVRVIKATKQDPTAIVDLDFWGNKQGVAVDKILSAEIKGGKRRHKRHEIALQRAGVLPSSMYIVPGEAAQLDQYGNMNSGQIVQVISWFRGFSEQGYQGNMSDRRRASLGRDKKKTGQKGFAYFALTRRHGKLLPGIYQRLTFGHGTAVKPVMIFVKKSSYKPRLDFYGVADKAARSEFSEQFPIAFRQAMATAR